MEMANQGIQIPQGYVLRKIGGRPKNTARDIAVFLARRWRTGHFSELGKQADEWILDRWTKDGLNDTAHIRRSIRAAEREMNHNQFIFTENFAFALRAPIGEGTPGWYWAEGMTKALPVQTRNFSVKYTQEVINMTPTAIAARRLFGYKS